jgi:pilus assembly protein CpaE
VVVVDIGSRDPQRAVRTIELIKATTLQIAIFANGDMSQPAVIVASMRAGAGEFLDQSAGSDALLDALTRYSSTRTRSAGAAGRARVFTFLSAKGGAGCTTAAVNTALALQQSHGDVALLDFAPIGHAALHLNLRPQFGVLDALQNLHRMDVSLLDGMMTTAKENLHLLAGPEQPYPTEPTPGELARLFDLVVNHYRLLVAQMDVVSLKSASLIHAFLEEGTGRDRMRLILNRYKKIPGFTEEDVQRATNCKVLWKVPNAYQQISPSIDHGTPIVLQDGSEISRSYRSLAETLAEASSNSDGSPDLVYGQEGARKKTAGRLNLSPARAGQ